ncbi:putative superoxide dismutase copper chaperone Lys7 [Eremomyces bilateralis CBS 781.70]|uniref:Superoxide dismutase 1 copper chaperone n=1 Tax=Eremomyces bilateralis CBS 781.70 TaxID=1392243 RepID=A0A6G1G463_9PEZI|nr:putative superoxide dismutase copper chaperone Lys7 [Eremomyces bilateralis CBS 781.70]KAF1812854.1 putative superoxide dismutase copper chaperone Lys7 [Eremomyces bilateralis CBS 781.70]
MIPPFETTFAVPLRCDECIKHVSSSLHKLPGIHSVAADLPSQLVSVTGTAAPSAIVSAIQSTGRDAILRGSGRENSAAVCILETHADVPNQVRGLARMVQVTSDLTLIDLSLRGLAPGKYWATVREGGDISRGTASTGGVWEAGKQASGEGRGVLGTVEVDEAGIGSTFLDRRMQVWEVIGRSVVVSQEREGFAAEDADTLVGVVARSAGVWENEKTVCSCSGKTVWEERTEAVGRGVL